ncbi:hypothetical protein CI109_102934 [Kwoniella shandongensis]|uniref:FCP1 homology domain-containing protein n=1 Tax=Kwoniella shandongensis TaxID=1734106 RepID=A0A5M6CBT9_9TREE|nr:uncharacterized protein CI109_000122 [Kwoniella shandongensis]KAA5531282.1 hypothetical protein CI109_000122 [Kwoniella shandongensis]
MNTLSRLDSYLSSFLRPPPPALPARPSTPPSQTSSSRSSPGRLSNLPPTPRPKQRRNGTTATTTTTTGSPGSGSSRTHRRAHPTYSSIKVPPPTTPLLIRIALVLWSILLTFWTSLVGETRAGRGRKRRRRKGITNSNGETTGVVGVGVLRELGERVMASAGIAPIPGTVDEGEGSGSDAEAEAETETETPAESVALQEKGEWIDPVTRAPEGQDSLEEAPPTEDEFALATEEDHAILQRQPDPNFTFRLRSAPTTSQSQNQTKIEDSTTTITQPSFKRQGSLSSAFRPSPPPTSILSNPLPLPLPLQPPSPISSLQETTHKRTSSGGRLLANPISTSLLDTSVPAATSSLFRKPSPPTVTLNNTVGGGNNRPHHQTPFHLQKTLILDLDETLIHSTSRPIAYSGSSGGGGILGLSLGGLVGGKGKGKEGHTVEVVLNGRSTMYHVYKRPYVDHFLKKVASWYTLVIFTASMPEYADPVIDWLDAGRNLFARKLYRDSCHLQPNGSYIKDLSLVEADLARVCFMDNSPISYNWNKANALPIEGWTSDPNDEALLHSIPVLDSLRFVNDVRRVLGIRGFS